MDRELYMKNKYLYYRKKLDYLIDYIDKYHPHDLVHMSKKKLDMDLLEDKNNIINSWLSDVYYNPNGLWTSCGSSWLKFLKENNMYHSSWIKCKYIYVVKLGSNIVSLSASLHTSKDVLHITKIKELIDFHCKYAKYKKGQGYKMDWTKIKKKYAGLVICPYLGNKIWKREETGEFVDAFYLGSEEEKYILDALQKNIMKYPHLYLEWYRHWEASTGVIWRVKSIESIDLLFQFQYEK